MRSHLVCSVGEKGLIVFKLCCVVSFKDLRLTCVSLEL